MTTPEQGTALNQVELVKRNQEIQKSIKTRHVLVMPVSDGYSKLTSASKVTLSLPGSPLDPNEVMYPVTLKEFGELKMNEGYTIEKLRDKYEKFFSPDNFRLVVGSSGKMLKIEESEYDYLLYKALLAHPRCAKATDSINSLEHSVYIVDKEAKAESSASNINHLREALNTIDKMTVDEKRLFLVLFGKDPTNYSDSLLLSQLGEEAQKNPKDFMSRYNDANKSEKALLERALLKGVVYKKGNTFFFGELAIGETKEDIAVFLKDKKNQQVRIGITEDLNRLSSR